MKPNEANTLGFPQNGWNLINADGRALGWDTRGAVSRLQRNMMNAGIFIGFITSPAVDVPSGKRGSYKGQNTIYNRGSYNTFVVLACVGGKNGAQPSIATTLDGNYESGSWSNVAVSTTTFLLQCQTQYSQTNFCISLPSNGEDPILVECNKKDKTQIFTKKSVRAE